MPGVTSDVAVAGSARAAIAGLVHDCPSDELDTTMSSRAHDGSKRQSDQATWIVPSAPTAADGSPGSRTGSSRSDRRTSEIVEEPPHERPPSNVAKAAIARRNGVLRAEVDDRDRTVRPHDRDHPEPTRGIRGSDGRAPVSAAVARRGRQDDRVDPATEFIPQRVAPAEVRARAVVVAARPTACRRGCREAPARRRPVRRTTRRPPSEQPRRRSASGSGMVP